MKNCYTLISLFCVTAFCQLDPNSAPLPPSPNQDVVCTGFRPVDSDDESHDDNSRSGNSGSGNSQATDINTVTSDN